MFALIKLNLRMLFRNKLHTAFLILVYGFGYMIPYGLNWFYTDNHIRTSTLREELYVFALLPFSVLCFLNRDFIQYDRQLFCTFIKSAWKNIYSWYLTLYIVHACFYVVGNTVFSVLSYFHTGYVNLPFTIVHDMVMVLQLSTGLFLVFAFLFLFENNMISYLAYGAVLALSIGIGGKNVFTAFPVTAYVADTLGFYKSMSWELWVSRVIQSIFCLILFRVIYYRYLKRE